MITVESPKAAVGLVDALEDAVRVLSRLRNAVSRLTEDERFAADLAALRAFGEFLRRGAAELEFRWDKLGGVRAAVSFSSVDFEGSTVLPRVRAGDCRVLMSDYRGASRALCRVIELARGADDAQTLRMVMPIVYRLEKELWLLDAARVRAQVGRPMIDLFLLC